MAPPDVPLCAQCAAAIEGEPITLGNDVFCCLGCVGGGPCICDRPITGHRDGDSLILRAGPFASQADLLRFAARLEQTPGLLRVEMTHADPQEARFSVVALSTEVLALAVAANPDHIVSVETSGATVYARVVPPSHRPSPAVDALLPAHTRFRVFRAPAETPAPDAAPATASPPPRSVSEGRPDLPPTREPERPAIDEARAAALLANLPDAAVMRAPEPPLAPPTTDTVPRSVPAAAPVTTGPELTITASPFHSFVALNEFQDAIRSLPGVRATRVRRFYGGTLNLVVDYVDGEPFEDRLRAATRGSWTIVSAAPDRIEVALSEAGSLVGARDR